MKKNVIKICILVLSILCVVNFFRIFSIVKCNNVSPEISEKILNDADINITDIKVTKYSYRKMFNNLTFRVENLDEFITIMSDFRTEGNISDSEQLIKDNEEWLHAFDDGEQLSTMKNIDSKIVYGYKLLFSNDDSIMIYKSNNNYTVEISYCPKDTSLIKEIS